MDHDGCSGSAAASGSAVLDGRPSRLFCDGSPSQVVAQGQARPGAQLAQMPNKRSAASVEHNSPASKRQRILENAGLAAAGVDYARLPERQAEIDVSGELEEAQIKAAIALSIEEAEINEAIALSLSGADDEVKPPRCFVCGRHSFDLYRLDDTECMHGACNSECYLKLSNQWIDIKFELREMDEALLQGRAPRSAWAAATGALRR